MPLFNRHPFYYTKSIIYPWQPPPPPVPLEIGNDSDDGSVFSSSDDAEMEEDTEDTSDDALNPPGMWLVPFIACLSLSTDVLAT